MRAARKRIRGQDVILALLGVAVLATVVPQTRTWLGRPLFLTAWILVAMLVAPESRLQRVAYSLFSLLVVVSLIHQVGKLPVLTWLPIGVGSVLVPYNLLRAARSCGGREGGAVKRVRGDVILALICLGVLATLFRQTRMSLGIPLFLTGWILVAMVVAPESRLQRVAYSLVCLLLVIPLIGHQLDGTRPVLMWLPIGVGSVLVPYNVLRAAGLLEPRPTAGSLLHSAHGTFLHRRGTLEGCDVEISRGWRTRIVVRNSRLPRGIDVALRLGETSIVTGDALFDEDVAVRGRALVVRGLLGPVQRDRLRSFVGSGSVRDSDVIVERNAFLAGDALAAAVTEAVAISRVLYGRGDSTDGGLARVMKDDNPAVRCAVIASAAIELRTRRLDRWPRPLAEALRSCRHDTNERVRAMAEIATSALGRPALVRALLEQPDAVVRRVTMIEARAGLRRELLDELLERGAFGDEECDAELARTLGVLGDPRAEPILVTLRRHESPAVRQAAESALALIGGAAPDAGRLSEVSGTGGGELTPSEDGALAPSEDGALTPETE